MTIFKWRQKAPTGLPLGLTKGQITQLRDLRSLDSYATFVKLLQDIAEQNGDYLLNEQSPERVAWRQGFIKALRDVIVLVPKILDQADKKEEEQTKYGRRREETDGNAFIGSPWLDVARRHTTGRDADA